MIDFRALQKSTRPNRWLAAPRDMLASATPDAPGPLINSSAVQVFAALKDLLTSDPKATDIRFDEGAWQVSYAAKILVFTDDVDVQLREFAADQTELAIYSRSRVGYSDFGVNKKRVEKLVGALRTAV